MITKALDYLRTFEPARLRTWYLTAVTLLASEGITLSPAFDAEANNVIRIAGVVVAVLQLGHGELIRRAVYSPGAVAKVAGHGKHEAE